MACDMEEEEGVDGEITGDEAFDSEPGTSATNTPASTPMPPMEMLVEQTTVMMEPEPKAANGGVITEQVMGLQEHQRPGSDLAGISVVMEQPLRSEPLPIRFASLICVCCIYKFTHCLPSFLVKATMSCFLTGLFSTNRADSFSELPPPPTPEIPFGGEVAAEEPVVVATAGVAEQVYISEGDAASVASVDR